RWVLVATTQTVPNAVERRTIIEESNKFSRSENELCAASILVIPNGFVRGVITLFSWMIPNVSPLSAAPTPDAPVRLAVKRRRELGVEYRAERAARAALWFHGSESSSRLRSAADPGRRGVG